ncbi:MAG: hypothetical protein OXN84_04725, partial [Albidovulum sp.]|nr:hypothetical protein [Albidovulum sp.]
MIGEADPGTGNPMYRYFKDSYLPSSLFNLQSVKKSGNRRIGSKARDPFPFPDHAGLGMDAKPALPAGLRNPRSAWTVIPLKRLLLPNAWPEGPCQLVEFAIIHARFAGLYAG